MYTAVLWHLLIPGDCCTHSRDPQLDHSCADTTVLAAGGHTGQGVHLRTTPRKAGVSEACTLLYAEALKALVCRNSATYMDGIGLLCRTSEGARSLGFYWPEIPSMQRS